MKYFRISTTVYVKLENVGTNYTVSHKKIISHYWSPVFAFCNMLSDFKLIQNQTIEEVISKKTRFFLLWQILGACMLYFCRPSYKRRG